MVAAFSLLIRPCPIANFIEGKKAFAISDGVMGTRGGRLDTLRSSALLGFA